MSFRVSFPSFQKIIIKKNSFMDEMDAEKLYQRGKGTGVDE
jgi:hypothetical protein